MTVSASVHTSGGALDAAAGGDGTQPANPLQLGQTLYEVLDVTVIGTPHTASDAQYSRLIYNADGGSPVEPLALGAQSQIVDVKAATDMHAALQNVYVLTRSTLQIIGSAAGAATSQVWPVSNLSTIVDLDPQQITAPHLLLLGNDSQGVFLQSLECTTGRLSSPMRLTAMAGTLAGAVLVRNQLDAHLVVCTVSEGTVLVHDLGPGVLGPDATVPTTVNSITLGATQANAVVGITTGSLLANTANQQVILAYPTPLGSVSVAALGFADDTLTSLASATPDLGFAAPERPVFRVAAGDVLSSGVDQIVVGYSATFGATKGCAALLLLELDAGTNGKGQALTLLSTYAAANTGAQPLASIDLHLAVGVFGDVPGQSTPGVLGVIVVGAGSTFGQTLKGEASIMAGLVPIDPNRKTFPPLGSGPGVPQTLTTVMTIDYRSTGFFALASDITGQSVILGPPRLSQSLGKGQLLALIQAPPYEASVSSSKPTLTLGKSVSDIKGYNVSSNKMWMFSRDTGMNIGIWGQTLGENVSKSYGHGFDKITDHSTSTLVQSTATISLDDLIVLYEMSYYVWTYPVYRKAKQSAPDGSMAVIFPMSPDPIQYIVPASDAALGYRPQSQSGVLLSYVDVPHDGYDQSELLFELLGVAVTDDPVGSTLTYDQTQMVSQNITHTFMVHNSITDSAHFAFSWNLFDYIPTNFGLNLSESKTYSDTEVKTTMLSHTVTMSIIVTSGSVTDIGYEYEIVPYIYQHKTMGCLMVAYDVTMSGKDWGTHYKVPSILLAPLEPNSKDPVLAGFSRSISFADADDGTVKVSVTLFNNSRSQTPNVVCEFYKGAPTIADNKLTPSGAMIGQQTLPLLAAGGRSTVSLDMQLSDNDQVVVKVYPKDLELLGKVYWAIYPPSAYASWRQTFPV